MDSNISVQEKIQIALAKLEKSHAFLTKFGLVDESRYMEKRVFETFGEPEAANIERAMLEIPKFLTKQIKINESSSSYGLKHDLEKYRTFMHDPDYISNGEFIMAMFLLGYQARMAENYPNLYFNYARLHKCRGRNYCCAIVDDLCSNPKKKK